MTDTFTPGVSRRGFLKYAGLTAGAVALGPTLAACGSKSGGSSGSGGGTLKFWDQPWGTAAYTTEAKAAHRGVQAGEWVASRHISADPVGEFHPDVLVGGRQ